MKHRSFASEAIGNSEPPGENSQGKGSERPSELRVRQCLYVEEGTQNTRTDSTFSFLTSVNSTPIELNWIESNLVDVLLSKALALSNSLSLASTKLEMAHIRSISLLLAIRDNLFLLTVTSVLVQNPIKSKGTSQVRCLFAQLFHVQGAVLACNWHHATGCTIGMARSSSAPDALSRFDWGQLPAAADDNDVITDEMDLQ